MTSREHILPNLQFYDYQPAAGDMATEVLAGLRREQPVLHPKFLYDETGSALFEAITRQPEYYPTRTESALLERHAPQMAALAGECVVTEPGAGNCEKVRLLLRHWQPRGYMALEISREQLLAASRDLALEYPQLGITAVCADYTCELELPAEPAPPRLLFFPGSTIGNFEPEERLRFLTGLADMAGPGGGLLIGADLHKDSALLNAAYNDDAGLTARFNLNMLHHLNQRLDTNFHVDAFRHEAFYNEDRQRIEMHLRCLRDQTVNVAGERVHIPAGTSLHTENSYKFRLDEFQGLLRAAGFEPVEAWLDGKRLFSLHLARVR